MKSEDMKTPTDTMMCQSKQPDWLVERDSILWASINNASPGDYWHECLSPICVVISCTNTHIVFCDKVNIVSNDRWTWGVEELKILPRELFFNKVQYARCEPKCHIWAAERVLGKAESSKSFVRRIIDLFYKLAR